MSDIDPVRAYVEAKKRRDQAEQVRVRIGDELSAVGEMLKKGLYQERDLQALQIPSKDEVIEALSEAKAARAALRQAINNLGPDDRAALGISDGPSVAKLLDRQDARDQQDK